MKQIQDLVKSKVKKSNNKNKAKNYLGANTTKTLQATTNGGNRKRNNTAKKPNLQKKRKRTVVFGENQTTTKNNNNQQKKKPYAKKIPQLQTQIMKKISSIQVGEKNTNNKTDKAMVVEGREEEEDNENNIRYLGQNVI